MNVERPYYEVCVDGCTVWEGEDKERAAAVYVDRATHAADSGDEDVALLENGHIIFAREGAHR